MQSGSADVGRRRFLKAAAAVGIAGPALAGCSGDGGDGGDGGGSGGGGSGGDSNSGSGGGGGGATVAAGPNGEFVFEPKEVTISTGETVTWEFESAGHNVECDPSKSDKAKLPDGAEAFASYDGSNRFGTNDKGTTFEHTFDVAGTYTYVCVPHASMDMVGTVVVE